MTGKIKISGDLSKALTLEKVMVAAREAKEKKAWTAFQPFSNKQHLIFGFYVFLLAKLYLFYSPVHQAIWDIPIFISLAMLLDLVQKFSTDFFSTLSCLILTYLIKEQQQLFETESKTVCSFLQNFTSFIFRFLTL